MPFKNTAALMLDLDGRIAYASTYFCDLVGVEYDKIAGRSCFDFVFPEDMNDAIERFETNKLPHAKPFRFRLRCSDGTALWTDIQGNAMKTSRGEVYALSATVTLSQTPAEDAGVA
jgi:PAS domain S-box-containing protein